MSHKAEVWQDRSTGRWFYYVYEVAAHGLCGTTVRLRVVDTWREAYDTARDVLRMAHFQHLVNEASRKLAEAYRA